MGNSRESECFLKLAGIAAFVLLCALSSGQVRASVDCNGELAKIDDKFSSIMNVKPDTACAKNNEAGLDKQIATTFEDPKSKECTGTEDGTVCQATYKRLQAAVAKYKSEVSQGCQAAVKVSTANCQAGMESACAANVSQSGLNMSKQAQSDLSDAVTEAEAYKKLTTKVQRKYEEDKTQIDVAKSMLVNSPSAQPVDETMKSANVVVNGKFEQTPAASTVKLLGQLSGAGQVSAENGGQPSILDYRENVDALAKEQAAATKAIDDFTQAAKSEITGRNLVDASLKSNVFTNKAVANNGGSMNPSLAKTPNASTLSGTGSPQAPAASPPPAETPATTSDSGSSGSIASGASGLATAASAAAKVASAQSAASTAAAAAPAADSYTAQSSGDSMTGASGPSGANGASASGGPPPPVANGSGQATTKPGGGAAAVATPAVAGHYASGGPSLSASVAGRGMALSRTGASGAAPAGASGSGSSAGSRDLASTKDAACTSGDCNAVNEVKGSQYNQVGALGMPKLGADPGLSTAGALDSLIGSAAPDANALDAKPTDPAKTDGGLFGEAFSPFGKGGASPPGSIQAAAELSSETNRSLFARVHSVHEKALQRGSVSLFHRKL